MSKPNIVESAYGQHRLAEIPRVDQAEINQMVSRAVEAKKRGFSPAERIKFFKKAAELFAGKETEFIQTAIAEGGKPYLDTVAEFKRALNGIELGIDAVKGNVGTEVRMNINESSAGKQAFTVKEPIGVVLSLSAFNHPINLTIHQTIPAIAAGCPVIFRPASATPLSSKLLIELYHQAGLPQDFCQYLSCSSDLAEKLAGRSEISFLSFIGSHGVGWKLRSQLAPGTRCALEHGGVAPVIIDRLTNYLSVAKKLARSSFYHAGQVCVSTQKIFVKNSELENFLSSFEPIVANLKTGDPAEHDTDVGPLISSSDYQRIQEWLTEATGSADRVIGGEPIGNNCISPAIVINPSATCKLSTEEAFGPVVCLYTYDLIDEAITLCNSLPYAFQAAVFSENIRFAFAAANKIDATAVMVNEHNAFRVDWMPFGGRSVSGMGLSSILHTTEEMSAEKLIVLNHDFEI